MSKTINLYCKSDGNIYPVLVDDEDYDDLVLTKWNVKKYPRSTYAVANVLPKDHPEGKKTTITMHRYIMRDSISSPSDFIDHINGDGLDNRKENLRIVDRVVNGQNRQHVSVNNKTGITGVYYREVVWSKAPDAKPCGSWMVCININGKQIHKSFACSRYGGYENAKKLAIKQRLEWEKMYYDKPIQQTIE